MGSRKLCEVCVLQVLCVESCLENMGSTVLWKEVLHGGVCVFECGSMGFCDLEKSILCGVLYDVECSIVGVGPMLHERQCYVGCLVWILCHKGSGMR